MAELRSAQAHVDRLRERAQAALEEVATLQGSGPEDPNAEARAALLRSIQALSPGGPIPPQAEGPDAVCTAVDDLIHRKALLLEAIAVQHARRQAAEARVAQYQAEAAAARRAWAAEDENDEATALSLREQLDAQELANAIGFD